VIHTPYDGSHKPFTIGLKPLDLRDWIDVDEHFDQYIVEKKRLYADEFENVLVAESGTEEAQAEVLEMLQEHLISTPSIQGKREPSLSASGLVESLGPRFLGGDGLKVSTIAAAGLLVQEDLVLMRKSPEGWRLVAASLCFPSAWNLREKFGKPLHDVHGPVPGFNRGTRNAHLIERMFDNLSTLVIRWNWSLYGDSKLYHPVSDHGMKRRFGDGDMAGKVNLRLERQTLRKLPLSRDILFTIRIYIDPLDVLRTQPDGPALARAINTQLQEMSEAEIDYKGLAFERDRLSQHLTEIASEH
jgi:dimethylamine monooxygenase subunit A